MASLRTLGGGLLFRRPAGLRGVLGNLAAAAIGQRFPDAACRRFLPLLWSILVMTWETTDRLTGLVGSVFVAAYLWHQDV